MKFLVLLMGVLFVFLQNEARFIEDSSEEDPEIVEVLTCMKSEDLTTYAETIGNLMAKEQYPTDDVKFNKFFGCYWKNKGIINEEGHIDEAHLKTFLKHVMTEGGNEKHTPVVNTLVENTVNECKDVHGDNYEEKAVKIQNCILAYWSKFDD